MNAADLESLLVMAKSLQALVTTIVAGIEDVKRHVGNPTALASASALSPASPFRENSMDMNKKISKEERQAQGIFFTPASIRKRLFEVLDLYGVRPTSILEPSFGSGEFLLDAAVKYPSATLYGVEMNPVLFNSVHTNAILTNADFLAYPPVPVDLVIGNPPYFVTKAKDPACMTGRGNIYVQFTYRCLMSHLKSDGVLAFILPTSFYNCSYYQPCRDAIRANATVLHCENLNGGFYETAQDTMLLVLCKTASMIHPYFVNVNGCALISPQYKEIQALMVGATTLKALGFHVKTGDVVWNENKASLHDTTGTLVVYSGNIVNNTLALKTSMTGGKKQYIQKCTKDPITGPAIVMGRGYGNTFNLSYAFVPATMTFHGENHVNVITATTEAAAALFPRILDSFVDKRTENFLRMFVGNGALSKTEVESVLPIFV